MSPVVRISDEVFSRLQQLAQPLVDSVNDVISRLLDEHDNEGGKMNVAETTKPEAPILSESSRHQASKKHPDYLRAPRETQELHDRLSEMLLAEFKPDVAVEQRTLVFRSSGKNFAAIQRLGLRNHVVDLSVFGEPVAFDDPGGIVKSGRFPHWSKIRVDASTDLQRVLDVIRQSHNIRMRRPRRNAR
jgi:hypothetical protein